MEQTRVLTAFVRQGGRVLLDETDAGLDGMVWPVTGSVDEAIAAVIDPLPSGEDRVVERGDPVDGADRQRIPVLIDVTRAGREPIEGRSWRHASDLATAGAPGAWEAYRRVSPRPDWILSDEEHGSTTLSLEALQVLRDEAAAGASWDALVDLAQRLIDARGEFTALITRIDRTMTRALADEPAAAVLERVAAAELDEAVSADADAADRAAAFCDGATVLTLSRSGTVLASLARAGVTQVVILESRPKREGVSAAESLAERGMDVSLVLDAAAGDVLGRREIDVVLVGADSVDPNGDVRNKVGTRTLALAAHAENVPVVVATASDKIADTPPREAWVADGELYEGPQEIDTTCRLFDRTPPELVDHLVTEVGSVTPDITVWIAAERRRNRSWREGCERAQSA